MGILGGGKYVWWKETENMDKEEIILKWQGSIKKNWRKWVNMETKNLKDLQLTQ